MKKKKSKRAIVTLTTDFGEKDTYVAQMKGVLLGINPKLTVVDVTHVVPPQDVVRAAMVVAQIVDAFPDDTIHVVVIDPGVGSERPIVGVEMARQRFIAPDNGLLALVARRHFPKRIVQLSESRFWRYPVSSTFHGRDIMAPVAGYWSRGYDLAELGTPVESVLTNLPVSNAQHLDNTIQGEVLWADSFGNLITNIDRHLLPSAYHEQLTVEIGNQRVHGIHRYYSQQSVGSLLTLIGSSGLLEIAVNGGSAAEKLQCGPGTLVRVFLGDATTSQPS